MMDAETKRKVQARLERIAGQVGGMSERDAKVEELIDVFDRYCND